MQSLIARAQTNVAQMAGVYRLMPGMPKAGPIPIPPIYKEVVVKPEEIRKLEAYLKRNLNPAMVVKARPRKDDSAEVYLEDEFLGVIYKDEDEGELSYNFSMAILDIDL